QHVEPWRMPLALADQGITLLRYLKHHPEGIFGIVVLLVAMRPGRIATWLGRGWVSWQLLQSLRSK
ncbi:MAG: YqjK-like family protein, partial [Sedimenticola sp.]|nr:YqjK-like family protein [Sedimenticola sp.]